jgi:hypothetical protein
MCVSTGIRRCPVQIEETCLSSWEKALEQDINLHEHLLRRVKKFKRSSKTTQD